jgi:hypothetical protein
VKEETKPKGLYETLCELYGWDPKPKPEDVIEAAWKEVPRFPSRKEEQ